MSCDRTFNNGLCSGIFMIISTDLSLLFGKSIERTCYSSTLKKDLMVKDSSVLCCRSWWHRCVHRHRCRTCLQRHLSRPTKLRVLIWHQKKVLIEGSWFCCQVVKTILCLSQSKRVLFWGSWFPSCRFDNDHCSTSWMTSSEAKTRDRCNEQRLLVCGCWERSVWSSFSESDVSLISWPDAGTRDAVSDARNLSLKYVNTTLVLRITI